MTYNKSKHNVFEPSSEDTLKCRIFSPAPTDSESWQQLCNEINTAAADLSQEYIWHRDQFRVFMPVLNTNGEDVPIHLHCTMSFGDNIEDEWFVVYILIELTKKISNIIVQVTDSDGEFLLIEAADYLPSWANPDSTENRVFIYKTKVHIIPPELASVDEELKLSDALQFVVQNEEQTLASSDVQSAIINRIGNYPEKHKSNMHNSIITLPLEVAALLKLEPKLIAPLVDTYCHHDAIDIRACRTIDYQNGVKVTVKFTKCLYAMLLHSKIIKHLMFTTEKDKSITLGKKIACGFKIIMNQSSDIFSSKEYHKFLKSLTDNGYFRGNIEGSQEYKRLLENAKSFFSLVECPVITNVAASIKEIIASEEYIKTIEDLKSSSSDLVEDDDGWLNIHPEQLNNMLNSRYGKKTKFEKSDMITPQNITKELTDFLKKTSDFEGIESREKEESDKNIDFDADQFVNSVEKMLKLLSSGEDRDEIDSDFSAESDYMSDGSEVDQVLAQELKDKLEGRDHSTDDNKSILQSMVTSIREEQASSGPTSNLMTSIGLAKTDFLDSDDDSN